MTANTITHDFGYAGEHRIRGISALAVRLGGALEQWGRRTAQPATREQLAHEFQVRREARDAIVSRGDAHSGMYQLLG